MGKCLVAAVLLLCFSGHVKADDNPAAPSDPATTPDFKVRMRVYLKKMFGPQAIYETVPGAISDHVRNFPHQWGRSYSGFGKRMGSQYGQFVISETIVAGVQALHSEDPRYFASKDKGIWRRTRHAVVSSFWVHKPGGGNTFAYSLPAGVYGSWAIATLWSPSDLQTPAKILQWGSVGMGIKVSANVAREFWPDIRRKLFHK